MDRADLLELLCCPVCLAPLESFASCAGCGRQFADDEGTPALIAEDAQREVVVAFAQGRSTTCDSFRRCFTFPARHGGAKGDFPYHLDLAHLDVLEQLPPGARILEIGCGGGQMRSFLHTRNLRYVGIDLSKTRVHDHLRAHGGPDILCDSHFLPFAGGVFDVVYSAAVTQYFACPHLAAQEVRRVLRPGGCYLGNVAFLEPWVDGSFFHMTPLGVYEVLAQAEFEIDHIWPGKDWSGFRAMLVMSGRHTRPFAPLGDLVNLMYRGGYWLADQVRGRSSEKSMERAARVAGAIAWIAHRPPSTPAQPATMVESQTRSQMAAATR